MDYDEFNALTVACEGILEMKNPGTPIGAGRDAFAIHGRQSAQVALLQSPILPAVSSAYMKKENFPGLPVDKPHTCHPWFSIPVFRLCLRFHKSVLLLTGPAGKTSGRR